ncbi:hypothetical protein [Azospirillum aestuarii]|uniref:hypothetical protein n=1 Tax=Azospirillum aestuarii TaxID=2802052 RepID=UPI0040550AE0
MPSRTRRRLIVVASDIPSSTPVEASMDAVAAAATALGLPVAAASQRDAMRGWTAAAVHPLQPLQTAWLRMVRESSLGIEAPGERAAAQIAAMDRLFVADDGNAALLGVAPGAVYEGGRFPLPDDRLNGALDLLKQALRVVGEAKADKPIGADAISRRLRDVRDILMPLIAALAGPEEAGGTAPFAEERRQLLGLDQDIAAAQSWEAVEAIVAGLARITDALGDATQAAGGVRLSYAAEAACRLRLAIRFKVRHDLPLPADRLAAADRAMTRLLNGGYPQLAGWLRSRLRTLAQRMAETDPSGNSRFIVLEDGSKGANGWTAQLLVNPSLPAPSWFALFQRLHNILVMALFSLKLELYGLLHRLAGATPTELPTDDLDGGVAGTGSRGAADYGRNGCAAVLVDVTIPRHGTLAVQQQWRRFTGDVRLEDGLPRPGQAYRITSALRAVNALCQSSPPPRNAAPALITRLHGLLAGQDQATADGIAAIRARIREGVVPLSLKAIDGLDDTTVRRLLVVTLEQVCQGYGLATDKALAAAFDGWFAARLPDYAELATLPETVCEAIRASKSEGAKSEGTWNDGAATTASAVGFGLWVSTVMEGHIEKRASFLRARFDDPDTLPTLVATLKGPGVQPVIEGPWAAVLHLEHSGPRRENAATAAPVTIRLQDGQTGRQPDELLTATAPLIEDWLVTHGSNLALTRDGGRLVIVWNAEVDLGPFRYAPVGATLTATVAAQGGPPLSLIAGLPVATLSDTIRSVCDSVVRTDDVAVHNRLAGTLNALIDASLRAGTPEGADPALAAPRLGRCRHLMLSSAELAQGADADYPRSYYPDDDARITLGANPAEIALQLSRLAKGATGRTLSLLVVNQGSGGADRLSPGPWTTEEMVRSIVLPLTQSGLDARTIILDYPMSVAAMPAFAPLCAPNGRIIGTIYGGTIYGGTEPVMDRSLWEAVRPALADNDAKSIDKAIDGRIGWLTTGMTGHVHLKSFLTATDTEINSYLTGDPDGRDAVSLLRCLKPLGETLGSPDATLDRIETMLRTLRTTPLPWNDFADADKAVLKDFPTEVGAMTTDALEQLRNRLRSRVMAVLTDPVWRIGLAPEALADLPLFRSKMSGSGADDLWSRLGSRWAHLLALDPGLSRCPSMIALYSAGTGELCLDAAFESFDGKLEGMLRRAAPSADRQAGEALTELRRGQGNATLRWVENLGQSPGSGRAWEGFMHSATQSREEFGFSKLEAKLRQAIKPGRFRPPALLPNRPPTKTTGAKETAQALNEHLANGPSYEENLALLRSDTDTTFYVMGFSAMGQGDTAFIVRTVGLLQGLGLTATGVKEEKSAFSPGTSFNANRFMTPETMLKAIKAGDFVIEGPLSDPVAFKDGSLPTRVDAMRKTNVQLENVRNLRLYEYGTIDYRGGQLVQLGKDGENTPVGRANVVNFANDPHHAFMGMGHGEIGAFYNSGGRSGLVDLPAALKAGAETNRTAREILKLIGGKPDIYIGYANKAPSVQGWVTAVSAHAARIGRPALIIGVYGATKIADPFQMDQSDAIFVNDRIPNSEGKTGQLTALPAKVKSSSTVVFSDSVPAPVMNALQMVAMPLTLATGNFSLSEAIEKGLFPIYERLDFNFGVQIAFEGQVDHALEELNLKETDFGRAIKQLVRAQPESLDRSKIDAIGIVLDHPDDVRMLMAVIEANTDITPGLVARLANLMRM